MFPPQNNSRPELFEKWTKTESLPASYARTVLRIEPFSCCVGLAGRTGSSIVKVEKRLSFRKHIQYLLLVEFRSHNIARSNYFKFGAILLAIHLQFIIAKVVFHVIRRPSTSTRVDLPHDRMRQLFDFLQLAIVVFLVSHRIGFQKV